MLITLLKPPLTSCDSLIKIDKYTLFWFGPRVLNADTVTVELCEEGQTPGFYSLYVFKKEGMFSVMAWVADFEKIEMIYIVLPYLAVNWLVTVGSVLGYEVTLDTIMELVKQMNLLKFDEESKGKEIATLPITPPDQSKFPSIEVIFAISINKVFGQDGYIPWKVSAEMKHFKTTTMGFPIIMGRKTFESLSNDLPGRKIIVVSSNGFDEVEKLNLKAKVYAVTSSLDEALTFAQRENSEKVFVVGGKELIREALPRAKVAHISLIKVTPLIDDKTVVLDFITVSGYMELGTSDLCVNGTATISSKLSMNDTLLTNIEVKLAVF